MTGPTNGGMTVQKENDMGEPGVVEPRTRDGFDSQTRMALAIHSLRPTHGRRDASLFDALTHCGWLFDSVVDGEQLCRCRAVAIAIARAVLDMETTIAAIERDENRPLPLAAIANLRSDGETR